MASTDHKREPESLAISDAERQVMLAALNRLSRNDRLVIALRFFEQMSESEMAEVLAAAPGTVKSRLSRALVRLRGNLEPVSDEELR